MDDSLIEVAGRALRDLSALRKQFKHLIDPTDGGDTREELRAVADTIRQTMADFMAAVDELFGAPAEEASA